MDKSLEKYFFSKYKKANFRVVPGHWPDFKSKEEIDRWFEDFKILQKSFEDCFEE